MAVLDLSGFPVKAVELPVPLVAIGDDCRGRMIEAVAAMVHGETPEAIAGYLRDGFPASVTEALERPFEREEMSAFVDLLLFVVQTP